jgi:hypothetical protein
MITNIVEPEVAVVGMLIGSSGSADQGKYSEEDREKLVHRLG